MDAAMFQFNLSAQPANGLVSAGGAIEDASALAGVSGADAFAVLLAQQLGQVVPELVVPDVALTGRSAADIALELSSGDAVESDPAAVLAALQDPAVFQQAVPGDSALLLQQSGFVPPVVVPAELHSTTVAPEVASGAASLTTRLGGAALNEDAREISTAAQGAGHAEVRPGQFSSELTAAQRQPIAVSPASFAVNDAPSTRAAEVEFVMPHVKSDVEVLSSTVSPGASIPAGISISANPQAQGMAGPNASAQPSAAISPAVGQSAWGDSLGDRVVWMVSQQHQGVELHLNPPSLGPLEVRLSMNEGQATLSFATQHLPVKEAIESATPRLREMLGESGISLGSVSVNVGTFAQQQGQFEQSAREQSNWGGRPSEAELSFSAPKAAARVVTGSGMVDIFA